MNLERTSILSLLLLAALSPSAPCATDTHDDLVTIGRLGTHTLFVGPGSSYGTVEIRNDGPRAVHFRVSQAAAAEGQEPLDYGEFYLEIGGRTEVQTLAGCPGGVEPRLKLELLPEVRDDLWSGSLSDVLYPARVPPRERAPELIPCPSGNEMRNRWSKLWVRQPESGTRGGAQA